MLSYKTNINDQQDTYEISLVTTNKNEFLRIFNFINEEIKRQAWIDEIKTKGSGKELYEQGKKV